MKVALVAPYPVQLILPEDQIKPNYRYRTPHPASWVRALVDSLSKSDDLEFKLFTQSRGVSSLVNTLKNGVNFTVIPQYEPARIGALHLHIPARLQFKYQIDKYAPDLVHGFGTESVYGLVASEQKMPSVVFIQGILSKLLPFTDRFSPIQRAILLHFERRTLRKATHLIAETAFGANWAQSINNDANVTIIPHAVNSLFLEATPAYSKHTCLCIGTIHNIKAVDIAIRALSLTSAKKLNLSIIGAGPLLKDMIQLSQDLGIEDRVKFLGFLSVEQIVNEMEKAQMLCILSRMDTSPNVLTEAHAAGLPVIGTRVGGIPDMIDDGKDGFLVDTEDFNAVAQYMDILSSDLDLVKYLGANGRSKVKRLNNPERIGQAHIQAYHKLLYSSSKT